MCCDLDVLGSWDVLYLGVLYHMEDPLRALRRLSGVTGELAVVETEAVVVPGLDDEALWRFFLGAELNGDEISRGTADAPGGPHQYRLAAHARHEGGSGDAWQVPVG